MSEGSVFKMRMKTLLLVLAVLSLSVSALFSAGEKAEKIEIKPVLVGAGLESGLEFKLARVFSMYAGISLDLHFKKAFDDFSGMIKDEDMRAKIDEIGYTYEGMQLTSAGVILGLKYYF